ncbi:hypothetical protein PM038_15890 [Halorubrum ezzemoulense]|uniref:hypothetical protein n=1 Tax=Halorubrum ezzemoulense TaxID=337243 RepID=UPI0023304204|nr:hypothetical protein [Halorubrum ezzemoulense]MDB2286714.1 hypothetical protein [Halorubrum ezzemoulense]
MDISRIRKAVSNPSKAYHYLKENFQLIHLLENPYLFITSRYPIGTHVFERDWDILVILDTCRVDALSIVSEEYSFLNDINSIHSLGGTSPEWIAHTFSEEYSDELSNTAYITSNPHAKTVLEDRKVMSDHSSAARRFYRYGNWNPISIDDLGLYDPVFSYQSEVDLQGVSHLGGVTPPRYMTDRTISVARREDYDQLVVHYMQPHYPWVSNAIVRNRDIRSYEERPERIKSKGRDRVFNAYLDDLRYVLDDVQILLNNVDAETVAISADHGDAFGEYGLYGHGPGRFHPHVRNVPWVETTAKDSGEYEVGLEPPSTTNDSLTDQLEALGYK